MDKKKIIIVIVVVAVIGVLVYLYKKGSLKPIIEKVKLGLNLDNMTLGKIDVL